MIRLKPFSIFVLLLSLQYASSQAQDEPKWEQLKENFKTEALSFGALLQVVGDFQSERSFSGKSGFSISKMRVNIRGALDGGFSYFLHADFTKSTAIVDARASYRVSSNFGIDAGLFKAPFSGSFLVSASKTDFVKRPQVVNLLALKRQLGVQAHGNLANGGATYSAGIFNGDNFGGNLNDNNAFLYVARWAFFPNRNESQKPIEIGLNAAYSKDGSVNILGYSNGKRLLYGGDFRWSSARGFLSGEFIRARLKESQPQSAPENPWGFHLTGAHNLDEKNQMLLRWDYMNFGNTESRDLFILGYNHWPTSTAKLQINYVFDPDDRVFKHHQLLINMQINF